MMIPFTPVIGIPGSGLMNEYECKSDFLDFPFGRTPEISITPYLQVESPDNRRRRRGNDIEISSFYYFDN